MKYLKFVSILLFTVVRKVLVPVIFFMVAPFRHYARRLVYNYKLQNGLWLKRLYERNPQRNSSGWVLTGGRTEQGIISYTPVSIVEYWFAYWFIWGWMDDDANRDVTDIGYIKTITEGDRQHWLGSRFIPHLKKELEYLETVQFGNTFELGDKRTPVKLRKCWLSALLWSGLRNGAYNFKYDQYETIDNNEVFLFEFGEDVIGWVPEDVVQGKQNYSLRFMEGED
jgi:hypothetical protein